MAVKEQLPPVWQALREAEALKVQSEKDMRKQQDDAHHHDRRVRELQSEIRSLKASKGVIIGVVGLLLTACASWSP